MTPSVVIRPPPAVARAIAPAPRVAIGSLLVPLTEALRRFEQIHPHEPTGLEGTASTTRGMPSQLGGDCIYRRESLARVVDLPLLELAHVQVEGG
jgi:hypothetical protein